MSSSARPPPLSINISGYTCSLALYPAPLPGSGRYKSTYLLIPTPIANSPNIAKPAYDVINSCVVSSLKASPMSGAEEPFVLSSVFTSLVHYWCFQINAYLIESTRFFNCFPPYSSSQSRILGFWPLSRLTTNP